ncbi:hypothetical protein BHM03_00041398 [Ensete ventricosum]|uniref:Uncharacterized protein n=1 Tax=Ensete ventricosum TaxID=4639 RepID=A0A445MK97_ENSVE|nr:hypothetical protein BHM03_00041398 [Ensete ventricosum]
MHYSFARRSPTSAASSKEATRSSLPGIQRVTQRSPDETHRVWIATTGWRMWSHLRPHTSSPWRRPPKVTRRDKAVACSPPSSLPAFASRLRHVSDLTFAFYWERRHSVRNFEWRLRQRRMTRVVQLNHGRLGRRMGRVNVVAGPPDPRSRPLHSLASRPRFRLPRCS